MTDGLSGGSGQRHFWQTGRLTCGFATRRGCRFPAFLVFTAGVLLLQAAPAGALSVGGRAGPALRANTHLIMASPIQGTGQNVNGFTANEANGFEPITCTPAGSNNCTSNYPAGNPTPVGSAPDAWTARTVPAFTLRAHPVPNPDNVTILLYCIDIHTLTAPGYGYELGSWEGSGMPNVGYVARILNFYYPNVQGEPSSLTTANQRAAAVQAAIWFFTDRFVLNTNVGAALRDATIGIVDTVLREGPLSTPDPPSLAISPASHSGHVDVLGPFTITTNHTPVTVTATGGTMHSSATNTTALPNPLTVTSSPHQIWLRLSPGNTTRIVTLQATSTAHVPSGNVYLFNQTCTGSPCPPDGQRLILAAPATLTTTVHATGEFKPFGSLVVKKTIEGPAAHARGEVRIQVRCTDGVHRPDFVIAPGSSVREHTYHNIPADTQCTVTEISNGTSTTVVHEVTGSGQEVTIPGGGEKTVELKDLYRFVPGKLIVRKIIGGEAAGRQGRIVIRTECDGRHMTPDFEIPAGAGAGVHTNATTYTIDPTPATCTVTQTVDGHTTTVSPPVTVGSGQKVHIGPGDTKEAVITDDYGLRPGELEVTKFINGSEAGHQGQIVIQAVCNGVHQLPDFVIPAGTTNPVPTHTFPNIPTPATCVVTETSDGSSSTISVDVTGSPTTVKIRPGGSGAAEITDSYGATPGSLLVTKTIAGPSAGHQGPVTIHAVCDGLALSPDFVIPAHTHAGTVSHSFDDIPAGSTCTVTETATGATSTVIVEVLGNNQTVTIPAGKVEAVSLTDVYDDGSPEVEVPEEPGSPAVDAIGSLTVVKHITGPAARHHGRIAILVACGGTLENFVFAVPAGTGTGSLTHHFDNIPSGLRCTVTETADGSTSSISATAAGRTQTVTIPANGAVTVHMTDTFNVRAAPRPPAVTG